MEDKELEEAIKEAASNLNMDVEEGAESSDNEDGQPKKKRKKGQGEVEGTERAESGGQDD